MPDNPPMMNTPPEIQSEVAEEFAKTVAARMDGAHNARLSVGDMLSVAVKPDLKDGPAGT
jgi:hypothetical protein